MSLPIGCNDARIGSGRLTATTPCRLQQHQQTNTLERREKRKGLHQYQSSRILHACALQSIGIDLRRHFPPRVSARTNQWIQNANQASDAGTSLSSS